VCVIVLFITTSAPTLVAANTTYYVSQTDGDDNFNGLTTGTPFKTIAKVNSLTLQAGDSVLFKCGDTWRAEMLRVEASGAAGNPITFSSYPASCAPKPILSGAQPIGGWSSYTTNIYVADLSVGANAGKFPNGLNQLFRNNQRLPMGRWPNSGEIGYDNGYSSIDNVPSSASIQDNQLPNHNWSGAVAHLKGMRWYILNRQVMGSSGATLTLNSAINCYNGCVGWGYWLNNHLATLDQEGEWYYDAAANRVYLYTTTGAPSDGAIEGSVILQTDTRSWGGVTLGRDLNQNIAYVTIDNLEVSRWYRHGIATPTNYSNYELNNVVLSNNLVKDVDGNGIHLQVWVYAPLDGRPAGWRGGYNLTVSNNVVDGANRMGINLYSRHSTFSDNEVKNIALIPNLGAAGMGCSYTDGEGQCTEDGVGIRVKVGLQDDSGHTNLFQYNRLTQIGYNGFQGFGYNNLVANNVIKQACVSKGDCAGIRPYGDLNNLGSNNPTRNLLIMGNIIVDAYGNTDGAMATYKELFAFGINPDYGTNITVTNNTVISTTTHGILYNYSTGTASNNVAYNNGRTSARPQITVGPNTAAQVNLTGNVAFALNPSAQTVRIRNVANLLTSDNNYFFHPYNNAHTAIEDSGGVQTFNQWKTTTGKDANSKTNWYTQAISETPRSEIFYNDTKSPIVVNLGNRQYLDLDQNIVSGSFPLAPFTSRVLVSSGLVALYPTSLWFDSNLSPAQPITLTNVFSTLLTINSIGVTSGFTQTTTCPAMLSISASCVINVSFIAASPNPITGTLTIAHTQGAAYTASLVGNPAKVYLPLILR
jgi:hypothetical protein